jgi:hypothetical protein
MIQTKFGFHWSSTFRGEDFLKSLRRTTDDDDGRQVMAIAHMTLWVRWAKKSWQNLLSISINTKVYQFSRIRYIISCTFKSTLIFFIIKHGKSNVSKTKLGDTHLSWMTPTNILNLPFKGFKNFKLYHAKKFTFKSTWNYISDAGKLINFGIMV